MAKIKVAVIFGGISGEHQLSLNSAAEIIRNIPADKYEVICIGITKKGRWLCYPGDVEDIPTGKWEYDPDCTSAFISPDPIYKGFVIIENGEVSVKRVDVVFPVLQGKFGADGTLNGLLDFSGIPYVGCGLLASASCMDKTHTHMILDDYNIKTADWRMITQREMNHLDKRCAEIADELGYPLIAKPANSGSTIGANRADNLEELEAAVKTAFSHDNKVVVEKFIIGRELEAAVFGYDTPFSSYIGEIKSCSGERECTKEKFVSENDKMEVPAQLENSVMLHIREIAVKAYKALGCKGMARIDFFMDDAGELYLNKISTMPGFTSDCIYPKLMKHLGMELPYLIDKLIEQAIDNADRNY